MSKKAVFKLILAVIAILALSLIVQNIYRLSCRAQKQVNHEKIEEFLNVTLVLQSENADQDLKNINEWLNEKNVYPEDRGRLYEKISLIYETKGDTLNYYKALGNSLYYLELGNEKNSSVNIKLDLVNFYMTHCAYNKALELMESIHKSIDFDEIENLQIRGYAFREQAVLDIYKGDFESAENNLLHSREITNQSHTGYYEESYLAIVDVLLARVYLETGRYDEAKKITDSYIDSSFITQEIYHEVILRDFTIPLYEILYSWSIKTGQSYEVISEYGRMYCEACEEAGLLTKEVDTLLALINDYPSDNPEVNKEVYNVIDNVYKMLAEDQTREYAALVQGQINAGINEVETKDSIQNENWQREQTSIMTVMFIGILVVVIVVILNTSKHDSMTKLYNKRSLIHQVNRLKKANTSYAVIMIDIDDFKKVNDNYGHPEGDKVLIRLSEIMEEMQSGKIHAYRYGGEEFAVVISTKHLRVAYHTAEQIRMIFEKEIWDFCDKSFTISLGVAIGHGEDDVIKAADENLYISKKNGKNRVSGYEEAAF